jgi:ABC-type multidrug transport system fused ATPase/permease subunit
MSKAARQNSLPDATYAQRFHDFAEHRDHYQTLSNRNGNLTVVIVVLTIASAIMGIWSGSIGWWLGAFLCFCLFIASYINHARLDHHRSHYADLCRVNEEGQLRLRRNWDQLPLREPTASVSVHPFATDLDIVGHASLHHLLNTCYTPIGQLTLRRWLLFPANIKTIQQRQKSIKELSENIDFRQSLGADGSHISGDQWTYESLLQWAEGPSWLSERPILLWVTRILSGLNVILILGQLIGIFQVPWWLLISFINLIIFGLWGGPVREILESVSEKNQGFQSYGSIFRQISSIDFKSSGLKSIQQRLQKDGVQAAKQMNMLGWIVDAANMQRALLFVIIQIIFLWNFHVLWVLERWQATSGRQARGWLEAFGELEALISLATLSFDNPDWTFPTLKETFTSKDQIFVAQNLAHPLLIPANMIDDITAEKSTNEDDAFVVSPKNAVGNDISIGPPGSFTMVTGSNMSGKSTLLRSIGINIVLAQAGGPVCASSLQLCPIVLATSIRVQDSLEHGTSYFRAELNRLKVVMEQSRTVNESSGTVLVFLLDEILHGTNTAERQIAARTIITYLIEQGATGAVSTHDLTLAQSPEFAKTVHLVHFTEYFTNVDGKLKMGFDYCLHPGLATSTNALKLMEMVGLPVSKSAV